MATEYYIFWQIFMKIFDCCLEAVFESYYYSCLELNLLQHFAYKHWNCDLKKIMEAVERRIWLLWADREEKKIEEWWST